MTKTVVAFTIRAHDNETFAPGAFDRSVGRTFDVTNYKTGTLDRAIVSSDGKTVTLTCTLSAGGANYNLTPLDLPLDHYIEGPPPDE